MQRRTKFPVKHKLEGVGIFFSERSNLKLFFKRYDGG